MAQMTPEEFLETLETWAESLKNGTETTKSQSEAMLANIGVTKEMMKTAKSLGANLADAGKSAAAFTKTMYEGKQGAAAMNDAVDGLASTIDAVVDGILLAVAILGGPVGLAAAGIGYLAKTAVKGAAEYGKAAAKMSDDLYKSYQDLSRVGAAGTQGMDAVYGSMQKFGYGVNELDKMTALVKANSKELAAFSGTVANGANQLANTAEGIQRSGLQRQFMNMGMSVDDINKGIAGYQIQQGRLGQLQGKSQAELTAGAAAYLREMEGLTRLTGQQKEEMEAQRERANQIEQFYTTLEKFPDQAEEFRKMFNMLASVPGEGEKLSAAFAQASAGFVGTSKDSNALFMASSGEIMSVINDMKTRNLKAGDAMDRLGKSVYRNKDYIQNLGQLGMAGEVVGGPAGLGALMRKNWKESAEAADGQTIVNDGLTDEATKLRQKQMQTRDSLQDFVKVGVKPATEALNALAGGARNAASVVPGAKGDKAPMGGEQGNGWLRDLLGLGPSKVTGQAGPLLDLIGQGESKGNYNALVYGKKGANTPKEADLTNMTIDQVQKYQNTMLAQGHASTAVGKYQMIAATLAEQAKKAGLDTSKTKFDKKTQDLLAQQLVDQAGYGKKDTDTVIKNLAGTWASLSSDKSNKGAHDNFNGNQASIKYNDLVSAIETKSVAQPATPTTKKMVWSDGKLVDEATLTGPSGGYKPALSNANPSAELKSDPNESYQQTLAKTLAAGNNSWDNESSISDLLAENNALLRSQLSVQEKIKNNTA